MRIIYRVILVLLFGVTLTIQADSKLKNQKYRQSIRINIAGKERMLTQKMSKEALLIARGIEVEKNKRKLKETIELFDKILNGLYSGDRELNLIKTTDKEALRLLNIVSKLWKSFKIDIEKIASGKVDREILEAIDKKNIPLLNSINMVVDIYQDRANLKLDPHIARTINLAGKERMLTQKMTKELLLIANSIQSNANRNSLKSTGKLFKETLTELMTKNRDAMSDNEISKRVKNVKKLWSRYQNSIAHSELTKEIQIEEQKKQKKITQEISEELLIIANRVDALEYKRQLRESGEIFDRVLIGLIDGDATLGLIASKDKDILKELNTVKELWDRYKSIIMSADVSDKGLKMALKINEPLLEGMDRVVNMYQDKLK